jgi:Fic family protein
MNCILKAKYAIQWNELQDAWEAWIFFFLEGVETAARDAIRKSHALQDLHKQYVGKVQAARSSALLAKLINSLFNVPAVTIPIAKDELQITFNSAKNNIKKLVELEILEAGPPGRPQWFFAPKIIELAFMPP